MLAYLDGLQERLKRPCVRDRFRIAVQLDFKPRQLVLRDGGLGG